MTDDNKSSGKKIVTSTLNRKFGVSEARIPKKFTPKKRFDESRNFGDRKKFDDSRNFGDRKRFDEPRSFGERKKFDRSEEHTSELQSRPHLVCRLLLEKKK